MDPSALEPPTPLEQALTSLKSADNLFWTLAALLAGALNLFSARGVGLTTLGRRPYLLLFPLAVAALYLSDGFYAPEAALARCPRPLRRLVGARRRRPEQ